MKPGLLLLNKPVGLRSSYCVDRIKRILGRNVKVGHGGTLDSSASGLLVLLIGGATRLSGIVMGMPKVYRATIGLGVRTDTCDYTGSVLETRDWSRVTASDIDEVFFSLLGWRMQVPPKVSALRVGGRRAHQVFREGGDPGLKPRPVFIKSITRTSGVSESGSVEIRVLCGKGTYVRSVAEDIGRFLGCGAHIRSLEREKIGHFSITDALAVNDEFFFEKNFLLSSMLSPYTLRDYLPTFGLNDADGERIGNGIPVALAGAERVSAGKFAPPRTALLDSKKLFTVAGVERRGGAAFAVPEINIRKEPEDDIG